MGSEALPAMSDAARRLMAEAYESWVNVISATRRCAGDLWYKERVDEREADHDRADRALSDYVAGLEAALAFYSDPKSYAATGWQGDMDPAPIMPDGGRRARKALTHLATEPAPGPVTMGEKTDG